MANVFSLCNIPPWALASAGFNDDPQPLEIGTVRTENHRFFEQLDAESSPQRRGEMFNEYMSVKFQLHDWNSHEADARRSLRNSYVRFLRGWSVDSNSVEGAVLKGWVESRLGLSPTFHRGRLLDGSEDSAMPYALDRMKGHARTNAIHSQLDLLFEFCQYELARRHPGERWVDLFRGTFDAQDYELVSTDDVHSATVRMNNLSSFTSDRECAWEFGSTVWQVRVPVAKIFFFSGLLPDSLLKGEDEFLVIGGEFRVRKLLF
ncbi:MAG: NAD(+)--dinitrogen-reductase ADP-D-ribosyltransferase [Terrimicrobiaceae bacterium]|nr:NAD(+)--dinitrogen-reductase ADP-D-ribosyltransferase [Terrimicrobiaceae bacterium]